MKLKIFGSGIYTTVIIIELLCLNIQNISYAQKVNNHQVVPVPLKRTDTTSPMRPRMPAHQLVTGEYCDGYLTVDFRIPEGNCVLTYSIGNSAFKTSFPFDSSKEASFFLGNCTSVINISITTSFENEYEAVIDPTS